MVHLGRFIEGFGRSTSNLAYLSRSYQRYRFASTFPIFMMAEEDQRKSARGRRAYAEALWIRQHQGNGLRARFRAAVAAATTS